MAEFFQVQTNLVLPPGMQSQFEKRRTYQALAYLVISGRIEPRLVGIDKYPASVAIAG